ncbi:hypothetical protein EPUL_006778, partial [Erysiphe pulchra]
VHRTDLCTSPPATLSCFKSEEKLTQKLAAIFGPVTTFSAPIIPVGTATSGCLLPSASCQNLSRVKIDDHAKNNIETISVAPDTEYNFYLFRNSGESSPQKIILEQDQTYFSESGLDYKDGGFLVSQRNRSYYFTSLECNEYKEQLVLSAVDGETVKQWSRKRAWGLEVPWRVQVLKAPNSTNRVVTKEIPKACQNILEISNELKISISSEVLKTQSQEKHTLNRRKKPSKKDRISMRKKQRTALAIEEERARLKELKEQAEKEKKIRRNRGKKIKRKIKKEKSKGHLQDIPKV